MFKYVQIHMISSRSIKIVVLRKYAGGDLGGILYLLRRCLDPFDIYVLNHVAYTSHYTSHCIPS